MTAPVRSGKIDRPVLIEVDGSVFLRPFVVELKQRSDPVRIERLPQLPEAIKKGLAGVSIGKKRLVGAPAPS
jgi:hypothetical protein